MTCCRFLCFSRHCHGQVGVYALLFCRFCWYWGIPLPVALGAQIGEVGYTCVTGLFNCPRAGERIRGSSLMVTILPVLHTGQRQGLMPVSVAKRSMFVSGGCCFLITVSMPSFCWGTNCSSRCVLPCGLRFRKADFRLSCGGINGYEPTCRFVFDKKDEKWIKPKK